MSATEKLPASLIRELFAYNPLTGELKWRKHELKARNTHAGKVAGSASRATRATGVSYVKVGIRLPGNPLARIFATAHRIAWAYVYGEWPDGAIDHIDGNGLNNAISNLRIADASTNARNQHLRRTNTSGIPGVAWHKKVRKWQASAGRVCAITGARRCYYLGVFESLFDAAAARKSYDLAHGYGPAHGLAPLRSAA